VCIQNEIKLEKTVQETYNCVLQGLPLLHSSCIENLINNYVTVGVIRFSVLFLLIWDIRS